MVAIVLPRLTWTDAITNPDIVKRLRTALSDCVPTVQLEASIAEIVPKRRLVLDHTTTKAVEIMFHRGEIRTAEFRRHHNPSGVVTLLGRKVPAWVVYGFSPVEYEPVHVIRHALCQLQHQLTSKDQMALNMSPTASEAVARAEGRCMILDATTTHVAEIIASRTGTDPAREIRLALAKLAETGSLLDSVERRRLLRRDYSPGANYMNPEDRWPKIPPPWDSPSGSSSGLSCVVLMILSLGIMVALFALLMP